MWGTGGVATLIRLGQKVDSVNEADALAVAGPFITIAAFAGFLAIALVRMAAAGGGLG
ncbi:hypothetical protein ART_2550 [Arthrobacter sp. PAMC 25486]|nr:hypothetical protein ART_2550 [Arthrobacter sp. PAMC 25486]